MNLNELVDWTNFKPIQDMDISEFMQGFNGLEGENVHNTDFLVSGSNDTIARRKEKHQPHVPKEEFYSKPK